MTRHGSGDDGDTGPGRPKTKIVYFREVLMGDVRKLKAESNQVPSAGGGARDLRVRPVGTFDEPMRQMFPNASGEPGVHTGTIYWLDSAGGTRSATVEYWRPTDVRPGESRIARINKLRCWAIDEQEYIRDVANNNSWFFLLVLDDDGCVWARFVKEQTIPSMHRILRDFFNKRINKCRSKHRTICGAIDLSTGKEYP